MALPYLPPEILARIAAESVDLEETDHVSWLRTRHVCPLFRDEIERVFADR